MFLVNSRFPLVSAARSSSGSKSLHPTRAILLPKLRMYFAEFLHHSSPDRLGILYLTTCVGLGYGQRVNSPLRFSRQHGISDFAWYGSASRLEVVSATLIANPLHAYPRTTNAWVHLSSCVPLRLPARGWSVRPEGQPLSTHGWAGRGHAGTGISTCCASTTPVGLALAPDSPWAD